MNIKKFNKFLENDLLLESSINESIVYYSPTLRSKLKSIVNNDYMNDNNNSKIAIDLLSLEGENVKGTDITFINLSNEAGYLTHNTMKKVKKSLNVGVDLDETPCVSISNEIYNREMNNTATTNLYNGNKNLIKIGRAITILLKNKYNAHDIENFVNEIKSIQDSNGEIKVVFGEAIECWYDKKNYLDKEFNVLANSCMSEKKYFNLYTKNPNCGLVIMTSPDGKLVARALLWKLNSCIDLNTQENLPVEYYMDRIYYTRDHQRQIMERYAKKNGWAFHSYFNTSFKDKFYLMEMNVKINPIKYIQFPYMDTFTRLDYENWLLCNDGNYYKKNSIYLQSVSGKYDHGKNRNVIKRFGDLFRRY